MWVHSHLIWARALPYSQIFGPETIDVIKPDRLCSQAATPTLFAHHLYVCLPNCEEFRRHILLRNYLRSHPAEVSAYSNLKWDLFARFVNDRAGYIQGKADFVTQLVQRAITLEEAQPACEQDDSTISQHLGL